MAACIYPNRPSIHGESLPADLDEKLRGALGRIRIELPSWGFGDTGTRFGKYADPTAATSIGEMLRDAAKAAARGAV